MISLTLNQIQIDMQKSDRNQEDNYGQSSPSIATQVCLRCGNGKTRRSPTKSRDSLLNNVFFKSYRCQVCRFRFSVLNPLRLIWVMGILILFIPILGAVWMASNEGQKVVMPVEAVHYDQIKDLAEKGDANAELKMGLRHSSIARGVKNDKIAVQWFEKAAQHNQVEGQYRYGLPLLNGQGIVQDYKTAFYWLEKAANQGHAQAQSTVGEMYYSGIAINKDIERAYLWFNLAAAQGVDSVVTSRDMVVKLLSPSQIAALQQEAARISRGYPPSSEVDESMPKINESDPVDAESAVEYEPIPVIIEPKARSVIHTLKDWWEKDPF